MKEKYVGEQQSVKMKIEYFLDNIDDLVDALKKLEKRENVAYILNSKNNEFIEFNKSAYLAYKKFEIHTEIVPVNDELKLFQINMENVTQSIEQLYRGTIKGIMFITYGMPILILLITFNLFSLNLFVELFIGFILAFISWTVPGYLLTMKSMKEDLNTYIYN